MQAPVNLEVPAQQGRRDPVHPQVVGQSDWQRAERTGTLLSSIESGSRERIVSGQHPALVALLGQPLPADARINADYRGVPRLFVSATPGQLNAGQPHELRAFALASTHCTGVSLP